MQVPKEPAASPALAPRALGDRRRGFTLIELMIVILIIAVLAGIAIPNLLAARKSGNETAAIGGLKSLSTAQRFFRESDKEGDGLYDYGSLAELNANGVIDQVLGGGTKQGYNYASQASTAQAAYVFWATANPVIQGGTGDRCFAVNHQGTIFYTSAPITPDPVTGAITGAVPLN